MAAEVLPACLPGQEGCPLLPTVPLECWQGKGIVIISFISDNIKAMGITVLMKGQPHYPMIKERIGAISQILSPYCTSLVICVHFSMDVYWISNSITGI